MFLKPLNVANRIFRNRICPGCESGGRCGGRGNTGDCGWNVKVGEQDVLHVPTVVDVDDMENDVTRWSMDQIQ